MIINNNTIRYTLLLIYIFILISNIFPADKYFFYIQLADKNNSEFSLDNPSEYLSSKSLQRRIEQSISIDSTDLPVNSSYISQIEAKGVNVHSKSKWMNGVTVMMEDTSIVSSIRELSFVKEAKYTGKILSTPSEAPRRTKRVKNEFNYGSAAAQTNQLNGSVLHNLGYTGKNILIGVIDAGFKNVDTNIAFDSLRLQNRLIGEKSIISHDIDVYQEDAHGANVLSIMTANLPSQFLGVAPHASYLLIQTEYVPSEYLFEVDFWVSGIEYADSAGVDIVNSSLGYFEFDDASLNYTYSDMNGMVSRASRAANMASQKGIIVCSSVGNEGTNPWKYISAPSDADGILTVGAVNTGGTIASWSSYGPTVDERIKPDVCAVGWGNSLVNQSGSVVTGSGTSYSSPIITGMTACFLQYCKENLPGAYSVDFIRQHIIASSSKYTNPDDRYGYGIPDFNKVINQVITNSQLELNDNKYISFKYDYNLKELNISLNSMIEIEFATISFVNVTGNIVLTLPVRSKNEIISLASLSKGVYIIQINDKSKRIVSKIIIPE
ncbi:MAG: hypothetical protein BGO29_04290 [Bacteroidales bacterium 36-12]|nr:MAG: hypothetical protein BGO29_04290 [Bacteroidales bacterium 36-12]